MSATICKLGTTAPIESEQLMLSTMHTPQLLQIHNVVVSTSDGPNEGTGEQVNLMWTSRFLFFSTVQTKNENCLPGIKSQLHQVEVFIPACIIIRQSFSRSPKSQAASDTDLIKSRYQLKWAEARLFEHDEVLLHRTERRREHLQILKSQLAASGNKSLSHQLRRAELFTLSALSSASL